MYAIDAHAAALSLPVCVCLPIFGKKPRDTSPPSSLSLRNLGSALRLSLSRSLSAHTHRFLESHSSPLRPTSLEGLADSRIRTVQAVELSLMPADTEAEVRSGLLSDVTASSRMLAEQIWQEFTASSSLHGHSRSVWSNAWIGKLPKIIAAFAAGELSSAKALDMLRVCTDEVDDGRSLVECSDTTTQAELRLWHASWQRAYCSTIDFDNAFGWHALPATDPAWASDAFQRRWMEIATSGCRGCSDKLPVANGPLDRSSALVVAAERLLPPDYHLIAVCGSGTEAILAFYDIATAHHRSLRCEDGVEKGTEDGAAAVTDVQLLFFRGGYVGGAGPLQAANGIPVIAEKAFAPSCVADALFIDGAPHCRAALDELADLIGAAGGVVQAAKRPQAATAATAAAPAAAPTTAPATTRGGVGSDGEDEEAAETVCLRRIETQVDSLMAAGVAVGGVVVEWVTSHGVLGLRPAFVRRLRRLLHARRLLLFEDAVMVGFALLSQCPSAMRSV